MLEIKVRENGDIVPAGRFDASQVATVSTFFEEITGNAVLDFSELEYISSAGLGVLVATQKRLSESGAGLRIVNAGNHIRDIFRFSGLNRLFQME